MRNRITQNYGWGLAMAMRISSAFGCHCPDDRKFMCQVLMVVGIVK
jgi:hypothetical protein